MNIEKLKELERLLSQSDDFGEPLIFYMDHFADKPSFTNLSEKTKSPLIKMMLNGAGQLAYDKIPVRITGLKMLLFERLGIIHGGGFIEGQLFTFFYCKRINQGLMCISDRTGGMNLLRITPRPADGNEMKEDFTDLAESDQDITKEYINPNPN